MTWWAVKRVSRYSGQINVWLAGGFGLLYAAYTLASPNWPSWMGHAVFEIFDRMGGLPILATTLMVLATVPAAFQYGLGQQRPGPLSPSRTAAADGTGGHAPTGKRRAPPHGDAAGATLSSPCCSGWRPPARCAFLGTAPGMDRL